MEYYRQVKVDYHRSLVARFTKLRYYLRDWCSDGDINTSECLQDCSIDELEYAVEVLEEMSFEDNTYDFPGCQGDNDMFIDVERKEVIITKKENDSSTGGSLFGND